MGDANNTNNNHADCEAEVSLYLKANYALAKPEWITAEVEKFTNSNDEFINSFSDSGSFDSIADRVYQRWLMLDWNDIGGQHQQRCLPALPLELNLSLLNKEQRMFHGKFLLQIIQILDISRPLDYESEDNNNGNAAAAADGNNEMEDNDDYDSGAESGDDFGKLFNVNYNESNKNQGKSKSKENQANNNSKNKNSSVHVWGYGQRMLQMLLTDGIRQCLAIEYQHIAALNVQMIGSKVLLTGPLEVYNGTILLRPANVKVVHRASLDLHHVLDKHQQLMAITTVDNDDTVTTTATTATITTPTVTATVTVPTMAQTITTVLQPIDTNRQQKQPSPAAQPPPSLTPPPSSLIEELTENCIGQNQNNDQNIIIDTLETITTTIVAADNNADAQDNEDGEIVN